jgi:hypothetical protein
LYHSPATALAAYPTLLSTNFMEAAMEKLKITLFLITALLMYSCGNRGNFDTLCDLATVIKTDSVRISDDPVYEIIVDYVKRHKDVCGVDVDLYFSIYFSSIDSMTYFTIWVSPVYPKIFLDNLMKKKNDLLYVNLIIDKSRVVLIDNNKQRSRQIYEKCIMFADTSFREEGNQSLLYDGRLYFETYKYSCQSEECQIEKLQEPTFDFLEEIPPKQFW